MKTCWKNPLFLPVGVPCRGKNPGQNVHFIIIYEKKDKKKLREAMDGNRMNFPFMLLMGMTTGMMMGNMLSMNQMNTGDFMQEAYDQGYADGSGYGDGAMPADGGGGYDSSTIEDGAGGEGGFMDGGFDVGF